MFHSRTSRGVVAIGGGLAAFAAAHIVPGLFFVAMVLFAIAGVTVAIAFTYDWVLQGGEDLEAERRRQNEAKARK